MSVLFAAHSECPTQFGRAKLEESLPNNEEQSRIKDVAAVGLAQSVLKKDSPTSAGSHVALLLEGEQQNISHLVTIREVHQTKRAAKSTKTCRALPNHAESPTPSTAAQRHQICSQMADVIRRSGTGIERNVRWKSGNAPGTKDPAEVSQLSGNSANAELAAKERVNAVCNSSLPPLSHTFVYTDAHRLLGCEQDSLTTDLSTCQDIWLMGSWVTTIY